MLRAWLDQSVASAATLSLSFVFDEKRITGIPVAWQPITQWRHIDANLTETIFAGQKPATGLHLRVECLADQDYPVIESSSKEGYTPHETPFSAGETRTFAPNGGHLVLSQVG